MTMLYFMCKGGKKNWNQHGDHFMNSCRQVIWPLLLSSSSYSFFKILFIITLYIERLKKKWPLDSPKISQIGKTEGGKLDSLTKSKSCPHYITFECQCHQHVYLCRIPVFYSPSVLNGQVATNGWFLLKNNYKTQSILLVR